MTGAIICEIRRTRKADSEFSDGPAGPETREARHRRELRWDHGNLGAEAPPGDEPERPDVVGIDGELSPADRTTTDRQNLKLSPGSLGVKTAAPIERG